MVSINSDGSKIFKVSGGENFIADCINLQAKSKVEVTEVLALFDNGDVKLGSPYVSGAKVELEVINEGRGKKVITFKKRRRKDSKTKRGFRRDVTRVSVIKIAA